MEKGLVLSIQSINFARFVRFAGSWVGFFVGIRKPENGCGGCGGMVESGRVGSNSLRFGSGGEGIRRF